MEKCDIEHARVYVTTRNRYDSGNSFGEWKETSRFSRKKDFIASCKSLFDEDNPELLFTDWQDIPENFISENGISTNLFGLTGQVKEMEPTEKLGFALWLGRHEKKIPDSKPDIIVQTFKMCYKGYFGYKQRFTEYYAKEELGITKEGSPRFDFMTFNKYLFADLYIINSGFVFRKVAYEFKDNEGNG